MGFNDQVKNMATGSEGRKFIFKEGVRFKRMGGKNPQIFVEIIGGSLSFIVERVIFLRETEVFSRTWFLFLQCRNFSKTPLRETHGRSSQQFSRFLSAFQ